MKISHALRPDSRWDTWDQSRLRSTQRTLYNDTHEQVQDWLDGSLPMDEEHDNESWLAHGQDEYYNWLDYRS